VPVDAQNREIALRVITKGELEAQTTEGQYDLRRLPRVSTGHRISNRIEVIEDMPIVGARMPVHDYLISLQTHLTDRILAGEKTVEFRRRAPEIANGSRLWVYSKLPRGCVAAVVEVSGVLRDRPARLWQQYFAGLTAVAASCSAMFAPFSRRSRSRSCAPSEIVSTRPARWCVCEEMILSWLSSGTAQVQQVFASGEGSL
jgi:hypothetical protein